MKFISTLLCSFFATIATAGPVRNGYFTGFWCVYNVVYTFDSQSQDYSYGHMRIADIEDKISAYRTNNGGIVITRYLSGAYAGQTQFLESNPPEIRFRNEVRFMHFAGRSGGPFCNSGADIWIPTP